MRLKDTGRLREWKQNQNIHSLLHFSPCQPRSGCWHVSITLWVFRWRLPRNPTHTVVTRAECEMYCHWVRSGRWRGSSRTQMNSSCCNRQFHFGCVIRCSNKLAALTGNWLSFSGNRLTRPFSTRTTWSDVYQLYTLQPPASVASTYIYSYRSAVSPTT